MTKPVTVNGPATYTGNNAWVDVDNGQVKVVGNNDTVASGSAGIGIQLVGSNSLISVSGANTSITAGTSAYNAGSGNSLIQNGNFAVINVFGFNDGGVTLNGSYDNFQSSARSDTVNMVLNGSHDTIYGLYTAGNFVLNGNDMMVTAGRGNFTINGQNDTVVSFQAKSVVDTGDDNTVFIEEVPGQKTPFELLNGDGSSGADTTPGTAFTVTGANTNITTTTDNSSVVASGADLTVNTESYNNAVSASGSGTKVSTQSTDESITVSGANSTITTTQNTLQPPAASVPGASVVFTGGASVGAVFSDGATSVTGNSSVPLTVNLTKTNSSVVASANELINDSVGGNYFTINGNDLVDLTGGDDTVSVLDGSNIWKDTITGTAARPDVINFGSHDLYEGRDGNVMSGYNIININGIDNAGVIYQSDHDTLNINGSRNLFLLQVNSATSFNNLTGSTMPGDTIGSVLNVNGADEIAVFTPYNRINATNGAMLSVQGDLNTITGSNIALGLQGEANVVNVTGSDTIADASPFQYQSTLVASATAQNFFTVQSGQVALGGLDTLLQTAGTAQISLWGGNSVTLNGANDTVNAMDQLFGTNVIFNNGANNQLLVTDVAGSSDFVVANASTEVSITDDTGAKARIGGLNGNIGEKLVFLGGSGTSNTIFGAGSNAAVTMFGSSSLNNVVYGGRLGNNSLNGSSGGHDFFAAGGANDVLIAGTGGANTLVSAAGNETLMGSGVGNDLFSITGGGGTDFIQNFKGNLDLASNLSVQDETVVGGSLTVNLTDGTSIVFSGLSSVTQQGKLFTA